MGQNSAYDTDGGFDDEPQEKANWKVLVHTKSKEHAKILAEEASVLIKIIGTAGTSEVIVLDKMDEDNFRTGSIEKFNIKTARIGEPTHLYLNFKDKDACCKWSLQKVI